MSRSSAIIPIKLIFKICRFFSWSYSKNMVLPNYYMRKILIIISRHIWNWTIWSEVRRGSLVIKSNIEIEVSWYYCMTEGRKKYAIINNITVSLRLSFLSWNYHIPLRILSNIVQWYRLYLLRINHLFYHLVTSIMFNSVWFLD